MKTLAVVLLILGLAGVVFGGIEYGRQRTIRQRDAGSLSDTERQISSVIPVAGMVLLGGGVVILLVSQRKRRA